MSKPCWCEYDTNRRNPWNVSVMDDKGDIEDVWTMFYCPVCGRKLKKEDGFSGEEVAT